MFSNPIFPIIAGMFAKRGEKAGHTSVSHLLHFATATIKHEISGMVMKISLALVAVGVLIFALIMIGRNVHEVLYLYDNGPLLSGLFFGLVSLACAAGLFVLFRDKNPLPQMESLSQEDTATHMAEKILNNFLEGLNKGLNEAPVKTEKVVIVEDDESALRDIKINDYRYSEVVH
jgi:hypothetical protein